MLVRGGGSRSDGARLLTTRTFRYAACVGLLTTAHAALGATRESPCPDDKPPALVAGRDGVCHCPGSDPVAGSGTRSLAPAKAKAKAKRKLAPKGATAAAPAPRKRIGRSARGPSTFPCPPPVAAAPAPSPPPPPPPVAAMPKAAPAPEPPAPPSEFAEMSEAPRRVEPWSYGELHYGNFRDNTLGSDSEYLHLHRIVAGLGVPLSSALRLGGAVEFLNVFSTEDDENPDADLQQAWVELALPAAARLRGGLVVVPVGMLNESPEPTGFYGVERNVVESEIIPTTWSAPGVTLAQTLPGTPIGYDLGVQSGLRTPGDGEPNAYRPRDATPQNSDANLDSLGLTARLRYAVLPATTVGVGVHYENDLRQGGDAEDVPATLVTGQVASRIGRLEAAALYARWDLDSPAASARNRDVQDGVYGELGWRLRPRLGVFTRWSRWDRGGTEARTESSQWMAGANYWPRPQLVFKIDGKLQSGASDHDGFHLGVGYHFP